MLYDVFISHSSKDHDAVDEVASFLKKNGIKCFTDDTNLHAGGNFPKILAPAIRESSLVLLIFSSNSDISGDVFKELKIAEKRKKTIIPFRIEDLEYNELEYILEGITWQDGFPPPIQKHLPKLLDVIKHYLLAGDAAPPFDPVTTPKSPPRPHPKPPIKPGVWYPISLDKVDDWVRSNIHICDSGKLLIGKSWVYRKNPYTGKYERALKRRS